MKSLQLLNNGSVIFAEKCINGIKANPDNCLKHLLNSKSIATYLLPLFGYEKMEYVIKKATAENKTIKDILLSESLLTEAEFDKLLQPQRMYKLGYTKDDYEG